MKKLKHKKGAIKKGIILNVKYEKTVFKSLNLNTA